MAKPGKLLVIGLGPGGPGLLTPAAKAAIENSDCIVGYKTYLNLIRPLLCGKEVIDSGMKQEVDRAKKAVETARLGKTVAVVCSGDSGIYGMAGLVYEVLDDDTVEVEVVPGVPAFAAAASLLGAPLMHDFAAISLSDLLTPWEVIAVRLELAAQADFVIALYNPKSRGRQEQIAHTQEAVLKHRSPSTPVGIVRNAYRDGQSVVITDLGHMLDHEVDMVTVLIIGNSQTYVKNGKMITPRGYGKKYELQS